jgi:DNA-directed RNA polymerase subunit RPC12/RpoP
MLKKVDVFGREMYKCTHCGREFNIPRAHQGLRSKSDEAPSHECPLDRHPKMSELMQGLSKKRKKSVYA